MRDEAGVFRWRIGLEEIVRNRAQLTAAINSERPFEKQTLFIRGENSDYLVPEDLPAIHRLFPGASLQTVPGAGHLLHVEKTKQFVEMVLGFLLPEQRPRA